IVRDSSTKREVAASDLTHNGQEVGNAPLQSFLSFMVVNGAADALRTPREVLGDDREIIIPFDMWTAVVFAVGKLLRVVDQFVHRLRDLVREPEQDEHRGR